jgi:hypothetical protein
MAPQNFSLPDKRTVKINNASLTHYRLGKHYGLQLELGRIEMGTCGTLGGALGVPRAYTSYMRGACHLGGLRSPLCSTHGANRGLIYPPLGGK